MPASINEALFGENDAGEFSIMGALDVEGLIYLYLHNGREIYYAVSSNGADWALSPEPIFSGLISGDFDYFPTSIQAVHQGLVIYLSAATTDYAEHNFLYSIWTLFAPDPAGDWTLSEAPALYGYAGPEGYALYLTQPVVRPYLDGFRMYYAFSFSIEGIHMPEVAVAHSWDGLFWRYTSDLPTPEMTDGIVPLDLATEQGWAGVLVLEVWPTQAGWQMLYFQEGIEEGSTQIHLADSEDGLQWVPSDIEIRLPDEPPVEEVVSASMLYYQGQYLLTYCTMPQNHTYQCFIAANDS
jgi:hypothetical protein